jgi:diguanylate cyclase (GGDEF)-like protein
LDGFKAVNDEHGHAVGDRLLIQLADRLTASLREVDTFARLGGDEFVAVLTDLEDINASVHVLERMLFNASQPIQVDSRVLRVSASIGVSYFPQKSGTDAEQLLRQADQAMYHAKLLGKNRYAVFDAENDISVRGYNANLERIRQALLSNEFVLYYQPKVNMRTREFVGVEALIRWLHPQQGLLAPGQFLPLIENHKVSVNVGEWVIRQALLQLAQWQDAGTLVPISVNVGALQLQQPDFLERLQMILAEFPAYQPHSLQLEILETSALEEIDQVSRFIKRCEDLGVGFALDDFGTGYSSLTYLNKLPISTIKIDQSFVRDMLHDRDNRSILDGILWIMRQLNRSVIAEGVETLAHGRMLMDLGCELAQGYGIARPMPAEMLSAWLLQWQANEDWKEVALVPRTAV